MHPLVLNTGGDGETFYVADCALHVTDTRTLRVTMVYRLGRRIWIKNLVFFSTHGRLSVFPCGADAHHITGENKIRSHQ